MDGGEVSAPADQTSTAGDPTQADAPTQVDAVPAAEEGTSSGEEPLDQVTDEAAQAAGQVTDTVGEGLSEVEEVRSALEEAADPVVAGIAEPLRTVVDELEDAARSVEQLGAGGRRPDRGGTGSAAPGSSVDVGLVRVRPRPARSASHSPTGSSGALRTSSSWSPAAAIGIDGAWGPGGVGTRPDGSDPWSPGASGLPSSGGAVGSAARSLLVGLAAGLAVLAPTIGRWALPPPIPLRTSSFALSVERPG